ncbi:MAG: hypothetical protein Q9225_004086 [Loekoesia sp. 1 TL-2023]
MPLHLLGKKSWNVYNQENIDRVKRDEAAAAAREAAEEQRMQEVDAERRIQLLRGIQPEAVTAASTPIEQAAEREGTSHKRERKRRRIAGEDDTERDIRFAREDQAVVPAKGELQLKSTKSSDAPLMDHRGHIDLFPMDGSRHSAPKNADVEAEKAKKKKEYEAQYTMRFSNAAGFKQSIGDKPWYQSLDQNKDRSPEIPSKDVWGNEDPRRKEREKMRVAADDPMAAMQKGVSQLREVEKERRQWREERDREIRDLDGTQSRKRHRSSRKAKEEGLKEFSLDVPPVEDCDRKHRHQHRRRHRSRSHDDSREQSQRHHHRNRRHGKAGKVASLSREPGLLSGHKSQTAQLVS